MFLKKEEPIEKANDLLRISMAAKDEVIAAWKDRGDRYASHNDRLEAELLKLYSLIAGMFEKKDGDSDFKKLLEIALSKRTK